MHYAPKTQALEGIVHIYFQTGTFRYNFVKIYNRKNIKKYLQLLGTCRIIISAVT